MHELYRTSNIFQTKEDDMLRFWLSVHVGNLEYANDLFDAANPFLRKFINELVKAESTEEVKIFGYDEQILFNSKSTSDHGSFNTERDLSQEFKLEKDEWITDEREKIVQEVPEEDKEEPITTIDQLAIEGIYIYKLLFYIYIYI